MRRLPISTEEMWGLYSAGLSAAEVAAKLGCSVPTVKQRFRVAGLKMRPLTERTDRWYENVAKSRQSAEPPTRVERMFQKVFRDAGVDLVHNHPVGRYNIDLAHLGRKIAFELDGRTHRYSRSLERDPRKDAFLQAQGWLVVRIRVGPRYTGKIIVARLCSQLGLP